MLKQMKDEGDGEDNHEDINNINSNNNNIIDNKKVKNEFLGIIEIEDNDINSVIGNINEIDNNNLLCIVCMENERNCAFLECGHINTCMKCALGSLNSKKSKVVNDNSIIQCQICCPYCKILNKRIKKVYFN